MDDEMQKLIREAERSVSQVPAPRASRPISQAVPVEVLPRETGGGSTRALPSAYARKQLLGLVGSGILFIGVFMPIITIPIAGSVNYFMNGKGDGTIILILAAVSAYLSISHKYKGLWATGALSLTMLAITYVSFQYRLAGAKEKLDADLAGNPFGGMALAAMDLVQLQWGWAVLVVGAALLIAAAAIKE